MDLLDAVVIGGGHNGLTCAAYLGMAGHTVRVLERRDIVGGAAITEEFHPGFRNSVAAYTVSLLQPKVIRDLELHRHGLEIVARRAQNFLPTEDGRYLLTGEGRNAAGNCQVQRRRCGALPRLRGRNPARRRGAARSRARGPAQYGRRRRVARACRAVQAREAWQPAAAPRCADPPRAARPVHQIGRRLSRFLVCFRPGQGAVRLRFDRRQFRFSLYARHRLCPAAPCLRRGKRQDRHVGARHRRHGCDQRGDGQGCRFPRRAHRHRRRGARNHRRARARLRRRARRRLGGTRAHRNRKRQSKIPVRKPRAPRRLACLGRRPHETLEKRFRHIPHERRAIGTAEFYCVAKFFRASREIGDHHTAGIILGPSLALHGPRLSRCLHATAGARRQSSSCSFPRPSTTASRRRAPMSRACSASTPRPSCPTARPGIPIASRSPI